MISDITDVILPEVEEWRNKPLKKCYSFIFVDCMYVTVRSEYESKEEAVYVILGCDLEGKKEMLGLWMDVSESKNYWMQVFDEIKSRGVEDIFFISMDGVSGLEDGAKAIFPGVVVQRCIVHLIRNSIKYVPSKDYKKFTTDLKKVYGASSLTASKKAFEAFQDTWKQYPGAVTVRTIDGGNSIKFKNKYYILVNRNGGDIYLQEGSKVVMVETFDNKLYTNALDYLYGAREIKKNSTYSKEFDSPVTTKNTRNNGQTVPRNHPWKSQDFLNFLSKQKHRQESNQNLC